MDQQLSEGEVETGVATRLWRRAPWWRVTVIAAAVTTLVGLVSFAEAPTATNMAEPGASDSAIQASLLSHVVEHGRRRQIYAPSVAEPTSSNAGTNAGTNAGFVAQAQPASQESAEEQQNLAACHPHLATAPPQVPQVVTQPGVAPGHLKVHFWVNGAGVVVRQSISAATLGTVEEQALEQRYVQQLTFSLPNTKECRAREVELIGDFSQAATASGGIDTMVRMYPRYYFGNDGSLVNRD